MFLFITICSVIYFLSSFLTQFNQFLIYYLKNPLYLTVLTIFEIYLVHNFHPQNFKEPHNYQELHSFLLQS